MPIAFACDCGRAFSVADAHAGKRTKCPACGAALTVPAAPADEDEAYRLLADGPDPEPPPASRRDPDPAVLAPAPPKKAPPAPKPQRLHRSRPAEEREHYQRPRIYISPGVLGGLASMVFGAGWFFVGLAADTIYLYAPVVFFLGLVAVVRGVLGHPED
ncbi:MAG: hypothetical protein C0501_10540 [Isosphaera sp.]|nr:hypothetical protein [Isosphaera sp.]